MRRLEATGSIIESLEEMLHLLDTDRIEALEGEPVVNSNMVMSLDGAYSSAGVSGGLSSGADHALFLANRMLADVILVGAGTVRQERYRRPQVHPAATEIRKQRGQDPVPRLVITSASLNVGDTTRLLDGEGPPPVLAHPRTSDISRAPEGVELLAAGNATVEVSELVAALVERGTPRITCEGGPGLLGQLAEASLIEEYLLTLSPVLIGGSDVGLLGNGTPPPGEFRLHRVLRGGDHLMCSFRQR